MNEQKTLTVRLEEVDWQKDQLVYEPNSSFDYWTCRSCNNQIITSRDSGGTHLWKDGHKTDCQSKDEGIEAYVYHFNRPIVKQAKENDSYRTLDKEVIVKFFPGLIKD